MNLVFRSSSVFFALLVFHLASAVQECLSSLGTGINALDCQHASDALFGAAMQEMSPKEQTERQSFIVSSTEPKTRMPRGKTVGTCAIAIDIDRAGSRRRAIGSWGRLRNNMEQLINACVIYGGGKGGTSQSGGFFFVVVNPAMKDISGTCMAPNPVPDLDNTSSMLSSDTTLRPSGQNTTVFEPGAASAARAVQAPGGVSDPARQEVAVFKRPPPGQGLLFWPPQQWQTVVEGAWLWRFGAWERFEPELADAMWKAAGQWMLVKGIGVPASMFPTAVPSIPLRPHQPPPSETLAWLSTKGRWSAVQGVIPPNELWMTSGMYCLLKIGALGSQDPLVNGPQRASGPPTGMGTSSSGGQSSGAGPSSPIRQLGEARPWSPSGQLIGGSPPRSALRPLGTSPPIPPAPPRPNPESRISPFGEQLPWPNIFDH